MEKGDVGWKKSFSDEDRKAFGVSFGNDERQDIEANDRKSKHVLLKRKSTFQIDPLSSSTYEKGQHEAIKVGGWQDHTFFTQLRRKILIDLERHFGRKVEHDRLYSSLVYDFMFVQCFVMVLYTAAWIGAWENFDILFDEILFDGDLITSNYVALAIGVICQIFLNYTQLEIRNFAEKGSAFRRIMISRLFTVVSLYFQLLDWKGIWGILYYVAMPAWKVERADWWICVILYVGISIALLFLGGFSTTIGCPLGIGVDRPSNFISSSTLFDKQNKDASLAQRIGDAIATEAFNLFAAGAYFGLWEGMEIYLNTYNLEVDELGISALETVGVSVIVHGICFVLQFVDLYLHAENEEEDRKRPLYKRIVAYLVHVVVLNLAFFSSVCSFRGYWWILDIYFIFPGGHEKVNRAVLQFYSLLLMFLLYCGTSLNGGVALERKRYSNGILIPDFFLTYLLATKVDS